MQYSLPGGQSFLFAGLSLDQMGSALSQLGYDPVVLILRGPVSSGGVRRLLGKYVMSNIPAILGIELLDSKGNAIRQYHAITAFGYTYNIHAQPAPLGLGQPDGPRFYSSSEWIRDFLIHDDQSGPYRTMRLEDARDACGHPYCKVSIDRSTSEFPDLTWDARLCTIVLPLPRKVFILGNDAEAKAAYLVSLAHDVHRVPIPQDIVLHSYMVPTNTFKGWLADPGHIHGGQMSPETLHGFQGFYRGRPMYKLVWVTEFGRLESWLDTAPEDIMIDGEVLINTTSTRDDDFFSTIHIPGHFMCMDPSETDALNSILLSIEVPNDAPHSLLWLAMSS